MTAAVSPWGCATRESERARSQVDTASPMTDEMTSDASSAAAKRELRLVALATLAVCGYLLAWSIGTLPVLGDEAQHYRRAQVYYDTGFPPYRATHDPAYPVKGYCSIQFYDASLWHLALAALWRALGHPSFLAAQVYHLVYFFAFALFSYLTARRFYGRAAGLWGWALAVTTPMNLLFGTLFYLEIPALAFTMAAVYFLVRERAVLMGLALAGLATTKITSAAVLTPPILGAALLTMGPTVWRRLFRTALAAGVCLAAMLPDMLWRHGQFGSYLLLRDTTTALGFQINYEIAAPKQTAIPFSILDPVVDLYMFGVAGIFATVTGLAAAMVAGWQVLWGTVRGAGGG